MSITAIAWALGVTTGSPLSKLLLIKLADNANDLGRAWPSLKTIMRQTEMSERAVREHLRKLEAAGLVLREERFHEGVQLPSVYHMLMPDLPVPGTNSPTGGALDAPRVGRQVPTEPSTSKPSLVNQDSLTGVRGEFEEWYKLFPRRVGKAAAERAYTKARNTTSAAALLDGLMRYIHECQGREHQYIAHPATWLNAGRWADEAASATFDPDKVIRERASWLDAYGSDGRWIKNISGNGVWIDSAGVGPAPHDPRTLVTESDIARFPKALAMRDKLRQGTTT